MARKTKRTAYRDTKTGRFVSKATWTRSRARGGTRYKRTTVKHPGLAPIARPARPIPPEVEEELTEEEFEPEEYQGAFDTGAQKGKR